MGIPRPSSVMVQEKSGLRVVVMSDAWPASASSTELSTTSQTRWWRPLGPVDPMYLLLIFVSLVLYVGCGIKMKI